MSVRLDLELNSDLTVTDDGYLTLKISPDEGNSLSIESDGLMSVGALSIDGWNSKSGQVLEGLTIGQVSIYNKTASNPTGRIAATGIVHRLFTSHGAKPGEELTGRMSHDFFRSDIDYCLPGDIFRVSIDNDDNYDYYLILKVDPRKEGIGYEPGNMIAQYVKLGTWGDLSETDYTPPETVVPETSSISTPTTIGGSSTNQYAYLESVEVGDRVVINTDETEWLPDENGTSRTITAYERECIWHVKSIEPSELEAQVKRIRIQNDKRLLLEPNKDYGVILNPSYRYKVYAYDASTMEETFISESNWKFASAMESFRFDNPVKIRIVMRTYDNAAINETMVARVKVAVLKEDKSVEEIYNIHDMYFEPGDIDSDGNDIVPENEDTPYNYSLHGHYVQLKHKPNGWNVNYTLYYEYTAGHYELIPDDGHVPDFNEQNRYRKSVGYECVIDEPAKWTAPYEYKKYYTREYEYELIIQYGLTSGNFDNGYVDDETGIVKTDSGDAMVSKCIRSIFDTVLPAGKYTFGINAFVEEGVSPVSFQLKIYAYDASSNEYLPLQSVLTWSNSVYDVIFRQDTKVCIVLKSSDDRDITSDILGSNDFRVVKAPTINPDTATSNNNGYYVSYTYVQLTDYTPFVSGQFYREADTYIRLEIKPDNWDLTFVNYYNFIEGGYSRLQETSPPPEFILGRYYELVFDEVIGSDKIILEEADGTHSLYLRELCKVDGDAPTPGPDGNLAKDTLVRLSNAEHWKDGKPYWKYDKPYWKYDDSGLERNLSEYLNPVDGNKYAIGSIDAQYGSDTPDPITFSNRIRTTGFIPLGGDDNTSTEDELFTLSADGVNKVVRYVYTKNDNNDYEFQRADDWKDLPYKFKGEKAGTYVRFVFQNSSQTTITLDQLSNVSLKSLNELNIDADPYTNEEIFSIWYITDETINPTATTVNIARKRTATSEEIHRENVPIKCLDTYTEIASDIALQVGEAVTISDDASAWYDGTVLEENERKYYTYIVIKRDEQTHIFTLNNGKQIERKYLNKVSRIDFTGELVMDDPYTAEPTPAHDVSADDVEDMDEGNGGS